MTARNLGIAFVIVSVITIAFALCWSTLLPMMAFLSVHDLRGSEHWIGQSIAAVLIVYALPQLAAGVGLLRTASWSRSVGMAVSLLSILGCLLGIVPALSVWFGLVFFAAPLSVLLGLTSLIVLTRSKASLA